MKKGIGLGLVVIDITMLVWTGFTYTKKEKIIGAGPLQVSADKEKTVAWPPYLGGILLIGGIIIAAMSKKGD